MNKYEAMYIIDATLEDSTRKEIIDRFSAIVTSNGGTVDMVDEWGKRRLAYPINYKTEGYYVLMYFTAPPALPKELERNLQISDTIVRYLVVANDGVLPARREVRPAAPEAAPAPAPAPEAAEPAAPVAEPAAPVAEPVAAPATPAVEPEAEQSAAPAQE